MHDQMFTGRCPGRAAGANYYVVKAVKQEALIELVDMLCGVPA